MSYKSVLTKIDELRALVSSWPESCQPATLERDMALERVKSIYEMLRFPVDEPQQEITEEQECVRVEIPEEVNEEVNEEAAEEMNQNIEVSVTELEIEEQVDDDEIHIELVHVTQIIDDALQQSDDKRERLSRILSLYDEQIDDEQIDDEQIVDEQIVEETPHTAEPTEPEMQVAPEPAPEPAPQPELTYPPIELSINDRILLSEELFGGDIEALTTVINTLCQQPTLDDAMIYIAENYSWSGDNEGAQLLMSLLQNRYQS